MTCVLCHADNQAEFDTEVANHLIGLSNPGALAFPKVSVCLDCGFSMFTVRPTELLKLSEGNVAAAICGG